MIGFEIVVAAVSTLMWIGALIMAVQVPYPASKVSMMVGGGAMPIVLSVALIILNIIWIIDSFLIIKERKAGGIVEERKSLFTFLFGSKEQSRRLVTIMLMVILYIVVLIPNLAKLIGRDWGFPVATIIYLLVAFKIFTKKSWINNILTTLVTTGLVYFAMDTLLKLPMPK